MQFRDKTAYVWGLRYRWDPSLSRNPVPRFPHFMPPWSQLAELVKRFVEELEFGGMVIGAGGDVPHDPQVAAGGVASWTWWRWCGWKWEWSLITIRKTGSLSADLVNEHDVSCRGLQVISICIVDLIFSMTSSRHQARPFHSKVLVSANIDII